LPFTPVTNLPFKFPCLALVCEVSVISSDLKQKHFALQKITPTTKHENVTS